MRRSGLIAVGLVLAGVLAGCGSLGAQGVVSPTPETVIGTVASTSSFPIVAAFHLKGDPTKGAAIFKAQNCGGCHTLAAAGTSGVAGPNLDQLKPPYRDATAQVTNGGGIMQPYGKSGTLTTQQVADVAAYVVKSTGGTIP